jgi:hypothetical protein
MSRRSHRGHAAGAHGNMPHRHRIPRRKGKPRGGMP